MSTRTLTWLLWAVFFFLLPVPFLVMGGVAFAPLLRLTGLALLMTSLGIVDGVREPMGIALAIVLVQTLLLCGAVWLLARLLLWGVGAVAGPRRQAAVVAGAAIVLFVASLFPIYTTPASSTSTRSSLVEILD